MQNDASGLSALKIVLDMTKIIFYLYAKIEQSGPKPLGHNMPLFGGRDTFRVEYV